MNLILNMLYLVLKRYYVFGVLWDNGVFLFGKCYFGVIVVLLNDFFFFDGIWVEIWRFIIFYG